MRQVGALRVIFLVVILITQVGTRSSNGQTAPSRSRRSVNATMELIPKSLPKRRHI